MCIEVFYTFEFTAKDLIFIGKCRFFLFHVPNILISIFISSFSPNTFHKQTEKSHRLRNAIFSSKKIGNTFWGIGTLFILIFGSIQQY